MVLHELAAAGVFDRGLAVRTLTLPDRFIDHASPDEMYLDAGLTRHDIAASAMQALGRERKVLGFQTAPRRA
jgi:1-deoxy-D-xylulose-5-phosphate synthase